MKKISNISKIAATVLLGSVVMTGCGSSDSVATGVVSTNMTVAASIVDGISTKGLTLTFSDQSCFNNKDLNATNSSFTITLADLNKTTSSACTGNLGETFEISVNPLLAAVGSKKLSDEIGTQPLKGKNGKQVNIFSTIAIDTNQTVQDIDVNDATKPAIKALKSMIQLKIATGSSLTTLFKTSTDLNITALSQVKDENLSTSVLPDTADFNSTTLNGLSTLFKNDSNKTSISDLNTSTIGAIQTLKTAATTAATSPKLSVSSIALTIGSNIWDATANNFSITKTSTQTVATTDDVVFTINAAGLNDFNVSNSTLKAVITRNNSTKDLNVTLNGITINTNAASATIASGSALTVASNYITNTGSIQTGNALTTSDLSFSLNTLATAFNTVDANKTATAKQEIITALATAGTYTVTVGLSGIDANSSNLADMNTTLGAGFRGFTGTVIVK